MLFSLHGALMSATCLLPNSLIIAAASVDLAVWVRYIRKNVTLLVAHGPSSQLSAFRVAHVPVDSYFPAIQYCAGQILYCYCCLFMSLIFDKAKAARLSPVVMAHDDALDSSALAEQLVNHPLRSIKGEVSDVDSEGLAEFALVLVLGERLAVPVLPVVRLDFKQFFKNQRHIMNLASSGLDQSIEEALRLYEVRCSDSLKNSVRDYAIKYASRLLEIAHKINGCSTNPLSPQEIRLAYMMMNGIKHYKVVQKQQSTLQRELEGLTKVELKAQDERDEHQSKDYLTVRLPKNLFMRNVCLGLQQDLCYTWGKCQ